MLNEYLEWLLDPANNGASREVLDAQYERCDEAFNAVTKELWGDRLVEL